MTYQLLVEITNVLPLYIQDRGDDFRFCLIFIQKNIIKLKFLKKIETELKPVQTNMFRFGFLEQKPVQTGLARFFFVWLDFGSVFSGLALFFRFWLGFFILAWFFSLARFFSGFFSVWVFRFQAYKTKTKPNRSIFSKS